MANKELMEKLKLLLKELFQFENNDLDFGIYRIINIKRKEISEFIEKELFEIVKDELKYLGSNQEILKKIDIIKKEIEVTFGCDIQNAIKKYPETPKVKEFLKLDAENNTILARDRLEEEIYDLIIDFFSRYYDRGDFISKRRFSKQNKYILPYNGEEVFLHWVNNDQYYIKTTENFTQYSFKINGLKCQFKITNEEVEIEKTNLKTSEKKFFIFIKTTIPIRNNLIFEFGYRALTEDEEKLIQKETGKVKFTQDDLNNYGIKQMLQKITLLESDSLPKLNEKHTNMNGINSEKSELEWHLDKYTKKNTSDYFIHKNLYAFLMQELDFYIKNEIFVLKEENIIGEYRSTINKINVLKKISEKIITFLDQIENFQKKLWEKKKFIISTDYCITLDLINEKFYSDILKNQKQLEEWKRLFNFDTKNEIQKLKSNLLEKVITDDQKLIHLLKNNQTLTIDTNYFGSEFKYKILSEINDLDNTITGILINSDNFHALNLIKNKYGSKIDCIYIDPPYNTSENTFLYKNNFKHSSWLSMIYDRVLLGKECLNEGGVMCVAIDDTEVANLRKMLETIFGTENRVATIPVEVNPAGQNIRPNVPALSHDYFHIFANDIDSIEMGLRDLTSDEKESFKEKDDKGAFIWDNLRRRGGNSQPKDRPNQWFPIYVDKDKKKISTTKFDGSTEIWPIDPKGIKRIWRYNREGVERMLAKGEISFKTISDEIRLVIKSRIPEGRKPKTLWYDPKYSATSWGSKLLNDIFGEKNFSYPKSIHLVKDAISYWINQDSIILDYFAGSGTTGHGILEMNKNDEGSRKFILVEIGKYFETVLKPRILKIIFSDKWKSGKPQDNNGSKKQIIKYHTLEQYEDSINNIDFKVPNSWGLHTKDYKIKYMLDFETKHNKIYLNLDSIKNPFEYKLEIEQNNEIKSYNIDLIETFNYLYDISVDFISQAKNNLLDYIIIKGFKNESRILVIWRNIGENFDPTKDKIFVESQIIQTDKFDEILVNGNSLIKDAKSLDVIFKNLIFE